MIDTDLIVQDLRSLGHTVGHVISIPENAGEYEFLVDGQILTLQQVRELLESEQPK
jgi:hypothetical protein